MRTPLIVANWKMNGTVEETLKFLTRFKRSWKAPTSAVEVVLCPPFTALYSLSVALSEGLPVKMGAQNCSWQENGSLTGEISPSFLKELGCHYLILGHSERRTLFGETDEMISKKVAAVLQQEITPIFCLGETGPEREGGKTLQVIERQLSQGIGGVERGFFEKMVIAYEPVWAIGTGLSATPQQAQEAHHFIRDWVAKQKGTALAGTTRILYGGSVSPQNIASFMREADIDGALVGGASLEVDSFIRIVNY